MAPKTLVALFQGSASSRHDARANNIEGWQLVPEFRAEKGPPEWLPA